MEMRLCMIKDVANVAFIRTEFYFQSCLCYILLYIYIYIYFFGIQFNDPFKIISLIEMSQSIGGAKWEYPGKTT